MKLKHFIPMCMYLLLACAPAIASDPINQDTPLAVIYRVGAGRRVLRGVTQVNLQEIAALAAQTTILHGTPAPPAHPFELWVARCDGSVTGYWCDPAHLAAGVTYPANARLTATGAELLVRLAKGATAPHPQPKYRTDTQSTADYIGPPHNLADMCNISGAIFTGTVVGVAGYQHDPPQSNGPMQETIFVINVEQWVKPQTLGVPVITVFREGGPLPWIGSDGLKRLGLLDLDCSLPTVGSRCLFFYAWPTNPGNVQPTNPKIATGFMMPYYFCPQLVLENGVTQPGPSPGDSPWHFRDGTNLFGIPEATLLKQITDAVASDNRAH